MEITDEVRRKITDTAEGLYDETVQLIRDLVRIPSESPSYAYAKLYEERGYTKMYDAPMTLGGEKKSPSSCSRSWNRWVPRRSWRPESL